MGVTGIEGTHFLLKLGLVPLSDSVIPATGVFRRSAEIALKILRANKDSLRSVLETFLHDPLVEWISRKVCRLCAKR